MRSVTFHTNGPLFKYTCNKLTNTFLIDFEESPWLSFWEIILNSFHQFCSIDLSTAARPYYYLRLKLFDSSFFSTSLLELINFLLRWKRYLLSLTNKFKGFIIKYSMTFKAFGLN